MSVPDPQLRIPHPEPSQGALPRPFHSDDALRRTIDADLVPRLALSHRAGALPPQLAVAAGRELGEEEVEEFVRLVRGLTEAPLDGYIRELLEEGTPIEAVYLDLVAPAARVMGELWKEDACSFMDVSLALGRMQRIVRSLQAEFVGEFGPGAEGGPRILLSAMAGEQHTLGLLLVAEFFLRAGWTVEMGTPFASGDTVSRLAEGWFDVAGYSVACEERLDSLAREIGRARRASMNREVRVLVGGAPFLGRADLARRVGADGTAFDAGEAPRVAERLRRGRGSRPAFAAQEFGP